MIALSDRSADRLELLDLENLEREKCLDLWQQAFGRMPPKHVSLRFMRRVLLFDEQSKLYGGHSAEIKRAFKRSLKSVSSAGKKTGVKGSLNSIFGSLKTGTHLVREWNGRAYQVEVLEQGYVLDGKTYGSLSAIAKKITGAHWSGPRFFGLTKS